MTTLRIATFQGAATQAELVHQLFEIPTAGSARLVAAAQKAILEANPHLANLQAVQPGTPIIVPHLPELQAKAATGPLPEELTEVLIEARRLLASLKQQVTRSQTATAQETNDTLTLLKSREFRTAADASEVTPNIADLTASANARLKQGEARSNHQTQVIDALTAELQAFMRGVLPNQG